MHRLVTTAFLFYLAFGYLNEAAEFSRTFAHVVGAAAGFFLLIGLWTPICGTLIAIVEVWIAFSWANGGGISLLLATSGATLAMIGPGAWSMDARLFGRKHFEITKQ